VAWAPAAVVVATALGALPVGATPAAPTLATESATAGTAITPFTTIARSTSRLVRDLDVHRPALDRRIVQRSNDPLGVLGGDIDEGVGLHDVDRPDRAARDIGLVGNRADEILRSNVEVAPDVDEEPDH